MNEVIEQRLTQAARAVRHMLPGPVTSEVEEDVDGYTITFFARYNDNNPMKTKVTDSNLALNGDSALARLVYLQAAGHALGSQEDTRAHIDYLRKVCDELEAQVSRLNAEIEMHEYDIDELEESLAYIDQLEE